MGLWRRVFSYGKCFIEYAQKTYVIMKSGAGGVVDSGFSRKMPEMSASGRVSGRGAGMVSGQGRAGEWATGRQVGGPVGGRGRRAAAAFRAATHRSSFGFSPPDGRRPLSPVPFRGGRFNAGWVRRCRGRAVRVG